MNTLIDDVLFTIISEHKYTMFVCRRWRDLLVSNGITTVPANELIYVKEWALDNGLLVRGKIFDTLLSLVDTSKKSYTFVGAGKKSYVGLEYCVRKKYTNVMALFLNSGRLCTYAAKYGYLDILKWLRENGCPWSEDTCVAAASMGHLHILQWARENGCPWDEETCSSAAEYGHLDILQWARRNGCPWDEETCSSAADYGHLDILQWAIENGCPRY